MRPDDADLGRVAPVLLPVLPLLPAALPPLDTLYCARE
jgi:hypothetical protein